ncbi:hypothetical protein A2422_01165 [Candidatus Woesebacteria bacterium RIFOXYC1_FULL_31_51]|uniref:Uncharacterized protein n=1 Tax=Candidatus Woesebacteria bacterium GW2011_GWC2_31_9 TaxID=1618586 RepID=A0A0F9YGY1_9BACT|nr:MAG: hypothetical protein UR17_C0001G0683 [Candidatus Woesebacteria bacterium GW2011_GWF1_31_35]KKP22704.1 MAG: hypothetical protein UR11_C0002G0084 [Candidatus Woesebacteria bacterium GW2011_GWC1_30_29]KKP25913.1 MAG: hypothetical protein UR13_C0006G0052 [Candidatus Woesebacteria bacterium GW2011_GWD1_31_12]KKP27140.1 MAG: hypothetical protein UR16_C0006G0029 [Candidatus Woesebacteria bacterium GW2011_GWB1_31_29]KKP30859.1 MAG: hypothetical protein UR21_C0022G0007 [Candidatus Woesebacteria 
MDKINPEINKFVIGDTSKFISQESKFMIKPLAIFVIVIALLVGSVYFGFGQINSIKTKLTESKKNQKLLATKVSILQNVTKVIPIDLTSIDFALPEKGIAIYGMSQVKSQAGALGLIISNLRTGSVIQEKDGVSKATISFDVEGNEQAIYDYLGLFSKLLPLMKVDKVSISKLDGVVKASTTISVFSGELPKRIPSITSPVTDLTNDELLTLKEISTFSPPQFVIPAPFSDIAKEDPFN